MYDGDGECWIAGCQAGDKMVLEGLDGSLSVVCAMTVRGDELTCDASLFEISYEGLVRGVVSDFGDWNRDAARVGSGIHVHAGEVGLVVGRAGVVKEWDCVDIVGVKVVHDEEV